MTNDKLRELLKITVETTLIEVENELAPYERAREIVTGMRQDVFDVDRIIAFALLKVPPRDKEIEL